MNDLDPKLDRLLRAAAQAGDTSPTEVPFGFDTRVIAMWRSGQFGNANGIARLLRSVAVGALAVIVLASAAVVYQTSQANNTDELFGNEYAIADSAIQSEF
jgi:hypothetical protein